MSEACTNHQEDINQKQDGYVFISYTGANLDIAERTRDFLESNKIACWMAPKSIPAGSDYTSEIPPAIKNSKAVVLLLSEAIQQSVWVPKEIIIALNLRKCILALPLDNAQLNDSFNFQLCNVQWISDSNGIDAAYEELLACINKTPESGADSELSPEQLIAKRSQELAKTVLEKLKGLGRYHSYFSGDKHIKDIQNKLLSRTGEQHSLYDFLFPEDEAAPQHSISLSGCGGAGKTHQIIQTMERIMKEQAGCLPLYLELNQVNTDAPSSTNCLLDAIAQNLDLSAEYVEALLLLYGSKAVVFADGFNEVNGDDRRSRIGLDLCKLRMEYRTRFCVSSREDHTAMFNAMGYGEHQHFIKAEVVELTEAQIDQYFAAMHCAVRYRQIPHATRKLLATPQGCVMYAELVGDTGTVASFSNLGELLQHYCRSLLSNGRDLEIFEPYLMQVAYEMVRTDSFTIKRDRLCEMIGAGMLQTFKDHQSLHAMFSPYQDDTWTFSHQNYRDYYCGRYFADLIRRIRPDTLQQTLTEHFSAGNLAGRREVLELASAFLADDRQDPKKSSPIQQAVQVLHDAKLEPTASTQLLLHALIELFAFAHDNSIAALRLPDFDLTEICLSGYQLYDREQETAIDLRGATISTETFLKQGLTGAASTICTYTLDGRQYIAAFASNSVLIIDAETQRIQTLRDFGYSGSVNCACVTEIEGEVCVLLGESLDTITMFRPRLMDTQKISLLGDWGDVDSILCTTYKRKELIFCSTTAGEVFMMKRSRLAEAWEPYLDISEYRDEAAAIFRQHIQCRMTHAACNDKVYLCFGKRIWCLDPEQDFAPTEQQIHWNGESPEIIRDIHACGKYLFVNASSWVGVVLLSKLKCVARMDFSALGLAPDQFFFTKFSPVPDGIYQDDAVLAGIHAVDDAAENYADVPDYVEFHAKKMDGKTRLSCVPIRGMQTQATYTGVYYRLPGEDTVHIAGVSDDRSVELLTPYDEEVAPVFFPGVYDGVRSMDLIDEERMLCAKYDGTVLHMRKLEDEDTEEICWKVYDTIPVHRDWVWKVKYLPEERLLSCSYDGTLCLTEITAPYRKEVLLQTRQERVIDFDFVHPEEIWAITPQALYQLKKQAGTWQVQRIPQEAGRLNRALAVDPESGMPYVFCHSGRGKDAQILRYVDGTLGVHISWEDNVYIRDMQFCETEGEMLLFLGGSMNQFTYLAVYRGQEQVLNIKKESDAWGEVQDEVLSFQLIKNDDEYFILAVTGLDELCVFQLFVKSSKHMSEQMADQIWGYRCGYAWDYSNTKVAAPLCVSCCDNMAVIGVEGGQIIMLNLYESEKLYCRLYWEYHCTIHTHANLHASSLVDLSQCRYPDEKTERAVREQFRNYFTFD